MLPVPRRPSAHRQDFQQAGKIPGNRISVAPVIRTKIKLAAEISAQAHNATVDWATIRDYVDEATDRELSEPGK
jgi:hypothetical protein